MNEILISVILSVYNAEDYLEATIKSILNQSYQNFEFIIINDGSNDESIKIIEYFAEQDKRIIFINRENKGVVYSLNEALDISKGKYIAKIDHDDLSYPNRLKIQLDAMENRKLDICGGHYNTIDEEGNLIDYHMVPISHIMCVLSLASKVPFAHPSVMFRKSFVVEHQLQYGKGISVVSEDLDLWNDFYNAGGVFGNTDELVIQYRILRTSISRQNNKTILKETNQVLKQFIKQHQKKLNEHLEHIPSKLNVEEQSLVVRIVIKLFMKSGNFYLFKYFKIIDKKVLFCTFFSAIKNTLR
jgi:glycosyltransferase involved in cell wall biosynthesis